MLNEHDRYCIRRTISMLGESDAVVIARLQALLKKRRSTDVVVEGGRIGSRQPEFMMRYADPEPPAPRQDVRPAHAQRQRQPQRAGGGGTAPDFITDGRGGIPETGSPTWQGHGFDGPPPLPTG